MNMRDAFDAMLKFIYETKPEPDMPEYISYAEYARRRRRYTEQGIPMGVPSQMPWKKEEEVSK